MKQLKVDAIKDGSVIDHIPAGKAILVLNILRSNGKYQVSIGMNLQSTKMGIKDIVKIENHAISIHEFNRIALIAPSASITIIKEYEVKEKHKVSIPKTLEDIAFCPNPNCITNVENISTRFHKIDSHNSQNINFMCHYCEKIYTADMLRIKVV